MPCKAKLVGKCKLSILLVLLCYIRNAAIASSQSIEHTIDIHIPIAIPLDNVPFQSSHSSQIVNLPSRKSSVNNIYDQFGSSSDFDYARTGKRHHQDHKVTESLHTEIQNLQETPKKEGKYLDKGKLYFRKISKHDRDSVGLKKTKNTSHVNSQNTQYNEIDKVLDPTYEVYESQKTNSKETHNHGDILKTDNKKKVTKNDSGTFQNTTQTKDKWRERWHGRNIINVLKTRKVRKSHHLGENNRTKSHTENSGEFKYPKVSPVYIPNNDNRTDLNKSNVINAKRTTDLRTNNSSTNTEATSPVTTANYYDLKGGTYVLPEPKVPSTENYPGHFESTHERKRKGKHRRKNTESNNSTSKSPVLRERSSDTRIERYEPFVFRYEDYPFQAQNYSRTNFSNLARYHNTYQQNIHNRRQQEYENLIANDNKQQSDDFFGVKTKKHGKRGFKIISDLVNLITGNNGPPPKRYRAHIIGSDGYAFENNPFGSSQSLSLASQGLTLDNNPFVFTNGNNHNFGLTDFGNSKDLGQSFSFGSDGNGGHSLSLVNGNQGFGATGASGDAQKISFGTSANGDTFTFANIKDPKSQVENVFSSNSQSGVQTGASENIRIVTKEVPVPYPVHVEKKVPYFIRVPHDRAVPYPVHKPYPVHITKPVPYPVKVHVPAPYPVTVEKHIPFPVKVSVPRPVPIHIPKPYPVYIEKKVPYTVEKPVPYAVKVPYEKPVPVPIHVEKPVPYAVTKHVPFPVKIPVDKPFPLTIPKPYPITVEKPVRVPYKVPVPISINFPGKNEQFTTGVDQSTNTGNPTGFGVNAVSADFGTNAGGATAFGGNLGENNLNNAQQNSFPEQFNNVNNGNADYGGNNEGFDYGDPSNLGFNNAENVQNSFGNTGAGYDSANNFGHQGTVQADIPNINTVKVPEVNQNYQIYFDGTRQHKHKQTQDIFNEVNNVFDNLETKAVIPNFDQVGNAQNGRQLRNNAGSSVQSQPGMRGTARYSESHTDRNSRESKSPVRSSGNVPNQFESTPQNVYSSNESSRYSSGETNHSGKSRFPSSQEYTKIDYTLLGGSFESRQIESESQSSR